MLKNSIGIFGMLEMPCISNKPGAIFDKVIPGGHFSLEIVLFHDELLLNIDERMELIKCHIC